MGLESWEEVIAAWRYSLFEDDLAPPHSTNSTTELCADLYITVLDWPANCHDLNSAENTLGIVKRKMRKTEPKSTDELKVAIKATWALMASQQLYLTNWPPPWNMHWSSLMIKESQQSTGCINFFSEVLLLLFCIVNHFLSVFMNYSKNYRYYIIDFHEL